MNLFPSVISIETARAEAYPWPAPVPFTQPAPPCLDLSKCIPPGLAPFREFCAAVAESLQVPADAVPPLALALASLGTSRALEIELSAVWRETAPLWVAVLAETGERKSALLSVLSRPLHEWQATESALLGASLASYAERRATTEARLVATRGKLARATGPDRDALENESSDLAVALEKLPPLASPSLVTSDATPEALRDLLARNGEKAGWVSAEVDAAQLTGTRYAKSGAANFDLLLKCFTGDPSTAHRVGRDVPLERPSLSMALCVQPAALAAVLRDVYARDRGLVPRLCIISPASRMGSRSLHPAEIPPDLLHWWGATIRRLLDLPWPGRVMLTAAGPARSAAAPHIMRLTDEAADIFDGLRLDVESRIGETGDLRPICGFASKLPGVVARIALTLSAMKDASAPAVNASTMRAACEWAPFLLGHYRAVLGDACERPELKHARRLLAALRRKGESVVTARECFRLIDGADLPTMDDFAPVLEEVVAANYLRPQPDVIDKPMKGRTPSPRHEVNPSVFA